MIKLFVDFLWIVISFDAAARECEPLSRAVFFCAFIEFDVGACPKVGG